MKRDKVRRRSQINLLMLASYILLMVYAYIQTNRIINDIVVLVTVLIIVDGIYFFVTSRFVKIELDSDVIIQKEECFDLGFRLKNESILPTPYIYLVPQKGIRAHLEDSSSLCFMLKGREEIKHTISYKAELCGAESISLQSVILKSYFSFFNKEIKSVISAQIKILPVPKKIKYIEQFMLSMEGDGGGLGKQKKQALLINNGEEIGYELRPYIEGDSQRLIHWKIAAYKEELLVREREKVGEKGESILLILIPFLSSIECNNAVKQDKLLTSFISLVGYYLKQSKAVRVAYYKHKKWQYIKVDDYLQFQELQKELGEYSCFDIKDKVSLQSIIEESRIRDGIKIMVSSYWPVDLEFMNIKKNYEAGILNIWVDREVPNNLIKEIKRPTWHITDQYEIILLLRQD